MAVEGCISKACMCLSRSVFSLGYKSSESQTHPLTTPIIYTLAALYVKLLLYRSDVQANY